MSPRPISWWAAQLVSLGSLIAFFFMLFHVLAVIAPDRMPR